MKFPFQTHSPSSQIDPLDGGRRRFNLALAAAVASVAAPAARAQQRSRAAAPAQIAGADRERRLLEGARKEGTLNIYTSAQSNDLGPVIAGFEKRYGLKTTVWRAGSEKVLQRVVTEARANRFNVDVIETNGPELESLSREKLLEPVRSPHLANLMPQALRPHGDWVGTRLNVFVQAYNTDAVKKEELPKSWEDLLNPRWKGRLGIEAQDQDWLAGICSELGEARGVKLFKAIVAANGISVRTGHTLLSQLVASGEVPLALTVYNYKVEQMKQTGAPIGWFSIGPAIARPNGVGVARQAPNAHAAVLFYDYEISEEGQKILAGRDFVPTNTKVVTPFSKAPMKFVDAGMMLDAGDKWSRLYDEIFAVKAR